MWFLRCPESYLILGLIVFARPPELVDIFTSLVVFLRQFSFYIATRASSEHIELLLSLSSCCFPILHERRSRIDRCCNRNEKEPKYFIIIFFDHFQHRVLVMRKIPTAWITLTNVMVEAARTCWVWFWWSHLTSNLLLRPKRDVLVMSRFLTPAPARPKKLLHLWKWGRKMTHF